LQAEKNLPLHSFSRQAPISPIENQRGRRRGEDQQGLVLTDTLITVVLWRP